MSGTKNRGGRRRDPVADAGRSISEGVGTEAPDTLGTEAPDTLCLVLSMRIAMRRLIRLYDEELSRHDLTIGQFGLLGLLARSGSASIRELAARATLDETALSRGLAPLVRRGLVDTRPDERDGRRRVVSLSASGRRLLDEAVPSWRDAQELARRRMGERRFERIKRDLDALVDLLEAEEDR